MIDGVLSLANEIRDGSLLLHGSAPVRCAFHFSVEEYPIGVYSIYSTGSGALTLVRKWNKTTEVRDLNGLLVINRGRQFQRILPGLPLFLVEYTSDFSMMGDKVAFHAGKVRSYHAEMPEFPLEMMFEAVDLSEITILG